MKDKIIRTYRILTAKNNDLSTAEGRADERMKRIALTALSSALAKVFATVIPLITVKVSKEYLGDEIYGLWMMVTSLFSLFAFADLGLGNGLQTTLSRLNGEGRMEDGKNVIASTYAMLAGVAAFLALGMAAVYPFTDWGAFVNAQTQEAGKIAGAVVLAILLPKILFIPIGIVQRTQLALQEGYRFNLWSCVGSVLGLISVYITSTLDLGPVTMIAFASWIPVVTSLLNMIVYYTVQRRDLRPSLRYITGGTTLKMLKTGSVFFVLSVLTTIGLTNMDSYVVGKNCGLTESSWYSIALRISQVLGTVGTMLSTPLWGANGEAMARGDYDWVRKNTKKTSLLMLVFTVSSSAAILLFSDFVFTHWLGKDFSVPKSVMAGMLLMQVLLSVISPYMMVLNACGKIKVQILIFGIYTPPAFFLKFYLSRQYGVAVIPWIGSLLYFLIVFVSIYIISNRVLKKGEDGFRAVSRARETP